MEGLVDDVMREILTAIGGVDWCVTEFIRVTDTLLPLRTFHRLGSELQQGAQTQSGVPVRVQLLGSEPEWLALNAARAADLGAPAIDRLPGQNRQSSSWRGGVAARAANLVRHRLCRAGGGAGSDSGDGQDASWL
jgi:hypothetical protein